MSDSQAPSTAVLDQLTQGAFSAATSGERSARIRAWLGTEPSLQDIQTVYQALSSKDKGAARPLREKLDESRRERDQEAISSVWAEKAQNLLDAGRLNIADALAWQRDAAKAGAPLSKEPLAALKQRMNERIRQIEDLQHRSQVQREAAVLLVQRIEVLSTKSWREAQTVCAALLGDIGHWRDQVQQLTTHADWQSIDPKFAPQLQTAREQLQIVWDAFSAALHTAETAAEDQHAPLPPVPVWADELKTARALAAGEKTEKHHDKHHPAKTVDPQERQQLQEQAQQCLAQLQTELGAGHSKTIPKIAAHLRQLLKDHGRLLGEELHAQAHGLLAQAGELEDWQRWRANQIREDLVAAAEKLMAQPLGGRKQQEALRHLREQWKQADQGGSSSHALWKRFDHACNEAHKVVEAWLEKVREQESATMAQRQALIEELRAWHESGQSQAQAQEAGSDWKSIHRKLHEFSERWRNAGHVTEKHFESLHVQWKEILGLAQAPIHKAQEVNLAQRHDLIAQATQLATADFNIHSIKNLQQQWQQVAQAMSLERRLEQKLWDQFRKPLDDAFQRRKTEREAGPTAANAHEQAVLNAVQALDLALASNDAAQIRSAVQALDAALQGQAIATPTAPSTNSAADASTSASSTPAGNETEEPTAATGAASTETFTPTNSDEPASADAAAEVPTEPTPPAAEDPSATEPAPTTPSPAPAAAQPVKVVKAVRGDDRHSASKSLPAGAKKGFDGRDRKPPGRTSDKNTPWGKDKPRDAHRDERAGAPFIRTPRLSDAVFHAQRDVLERAQWQLKKISSQAQGHVLEQLAQAWGQRQADALPEAKSFGAALSSATRNAWVKALSDAASGHSADKLLLRLEIAASLPSPAAHLSERKAYQLQLLTRRHEASPTDTWAQDVTQILGHTHSDEAAERLQRCLKVLLAQR